MDIITKIMKLSSTEYNLSINFDENLVKIARINLKTNKMVRISDPLFDEDGVYFYKDNLYMISDDKTFVFESDGKKILNRIQMKDFVPIVLRDMQKMLVETEKDIIREKEEKEQKEREEKERQAELHKKLLESEITKEPVLTKELMELRVAKHWAAIYELSNPDYIKPFTPKYMKHLLTTFKVRIEHIILVLLSEYEDCDEENIRNAINQVSMSYKPYKSIHLLPSEFDDTFLLKSKDHYRLSTKGMEMVKNQLMLQDDQDD